MFAIFGEGFSQDTRVYVSRVSDEGIPKFVDARRTECSVIEVDDDGQSVTCRMPSSLPASAYNLWATNEYGVSVANPLNAARPQWTNVKSTAPGLEFKVIGKNMSAEGFGDTGKSYVVLANEENYFFMETVEQNPFAINVRCPQNVVSGYYDVFATNDGITWIPVEDQRQLYIAESVNDPYNIGFEWANKFNWDNVVEMTPTFCAINTYVLQNHIDNISKNGGGVIHLKEGTYDLSHIEMKPGVVLMGDGKDKTILKVNGDNTTLNEGALIELSPDGLQGFLDMQINSEGVVDVAHISQWDHWSMDASKRPGEYIFIKNIKFVQDMYKENTRSSVMIHAHAHLAIMDCDFIGYQAGVKSTYVSEYSYLLNNKINTYLGTTTQVASYADIEDNTIVRTLIDNDLEIDHYSQGIFTRGPSYVSKNIIKDVCDRDFNVGELICTEAYDDFKLFGMIKSATVDSVVVSEYENLKNDWDLFNVIWGEPYLMITGGRGLGQYRVIKSYDEDTKTIVLAQPFDIVPDETSQFAVSSANINVTIYDNYGENAGKGYWLYGRTLDSVICNNTGINTEGAFLLSTYELQNGETDDTSKLSCSVGYFVRMNENIFTGNSLMSNTCAVGVFNKILTNIPPEVQCTGIYGIEITGNFIKPDSDGVVPDTSYSEATAKNGICIRNAYLGNTPIEGDLMKAVLIENNTVSNSDRGISIIDFGSKTDNVNIGVNNFFDVTNEFEQNFDEE